VDNPPESVLSEVRGTAVQDLQRGADVAVKDVQRGADAAVEVAVGVSVQVSRVSGQVSGVADRFVDDAKTQVRHGAETQVAHVADGLDRLRDQTRALAEGRPDEAGALVEYVQDAADVLGELADHIHDGGLDGVVVDLKRFARARPVVFLAGSAFAGLAIGRLLKNEAAAAQRRQVQDQSPAAETDDGGSAEPSTGPAPRAASAPPVPEGGAAQ
jgi:hypothetical protein